MRRHHFVGLDLGQRRDPSAVVVLERAEMRRRWRYRVRFLERIKLDTPYPDVVARVREVTRCGDLDGRCTLVADATGVGAAVVDMLRRANLRCGMEPVIITCGQQESYRGGMWGVPKQGLVTGLRSMLENVELELSRTVPGVDALVRELENFGAWRSGEHDDLVMALALACWRARRRPR